MPGRAARGARRCATQPISYRCAFFMCVVYSWYLSCTLNALCAPPYTHTHTHTPSCTSCTFYNMVIQHAGYKAPMIFCDICHQPVMGFAFRCTSNQCAPITGADVLYDLCYIHYNEGKHSKDHPFRCNIPTGDIRTEHQKRYLTFNQFLS